MPSMLISSSLLLRNSVSSSPTSRFGCWSSSLTPLSTRRQRVHHRSPPLLAVVSSNFSSVIRAHQPLDRHRHHHYHHWRQNLHFHNANLSSGKWWRLSGSGCSFSTLLTTTRCSTSDTRNDFDNDDDDDNDENAISCPYRQRLSSLRNVGIFAHVDAGKTTVTERMLALSGMVRHPGSVDGGDTVTDYLPAERERGITIQSAAVGFEWCVPPSSVFSPSNYLKSSSKTEGTSGGGGRTVSINLIDTPGHVDFSVEVHRSVAVLDGAILVVDAVAGAQAQTETVWRAIRNTDASNGSIQKQHDEKINISTGGVNRIHGTHAHEPLPALMFVNKMDREGADFTYAMQSVKSKLRGSNPIPIQIPLYRSSHRSNDTREVIMASHDHGEYIGLVDLVHMRAIIYPTNSESLSVEDAAPTVIPLLGRKTTANQQQQQLPHEISPSVLKTALDARRELIVNLANVDEIMEDFYLMAMMNQEEGGEENKSCSIIENISTEQIQSSLRRMTLARRIMPTMCGAALRGLGVEPVLDSIAEYLPCPLDRLPPQLSLLGNNAQSEILGREKQQVRNKPENGDDGKSIIRLGHPLHPSTLAYVFKVLHMKGRGGSGDGRVAFARVYSGTLKARDSVRVISPGGNADKSLSDNEGGKNKKQKLPVERIGGMLELSGGTFGNLPDGFCSSGDVCALVGLKGVVTGDTLLSTSVAGDVGTSDVKRRNGKTGKTNDVYWKQYMEGVHLSGLTSPKPVLTLRVEANSVSEQTRLSAALAMLTVEDPSLVVEETPTTTLISGLGELHMEIVLDRLRREFGLVVRTGKPAVSYRETIMLKNGEEAETDGLVEYDRTVGAVRLQGAVHLKLRQCNDTSSAGCYPPIDPVVTLSSEIRTFFNLDPKPTPNEIEHKYPQALQALLSGVRGSLKRGRLGPYPLANLECQVMRAHSELSSPDTLPGSMRAAAANAATTLLETMAKEGKMVILEPKMNVEIWVPSARVGDVLSDLTGRRGTVDDVAMAEEVGGGTSHVKSMVRAEVPLLEILGYATSLRSLTGGEGAFSAEYKGHAPQDGV